MSEEISEVKRTSRVSQGHIDQLNSYASNFSGEDVEIIEKILVVPVGADTSIVPKDIKIMFLENL